MRSNNERLIERYISGRMGDAEQRQFLAQAESDPGLRRMLKAEQVIGNAIARDRASLPLGATEPSAGILAKLGATNPGALAGGAAAGQTAGIAGGAAAGSALAGGSSFIGTLLLGSKLAQIALGVAAAAGIAVGTLIIAPSLNRSSAPPATTPASRHDAPAPRLDADRAPASLPRPTGTNGTAATSPQAVKRAETAPARSATTTRRDGIAQPPARDASSAAAIGRAGHHANDPAPIEVENTQVKVDIKIDQKKAR